MLLSINSTDAISRVEYIDLRKGFFGKKFSALLLNQNPTDTQPRDKMNVLFHHGSIVIRHKNIHKSQKNALNDENHISSPPE